MATTPTPPSSSLPQPLSYQQIVGMMNSGYASSLGINDLNVGSANVSFFNIVGLMVARASGDIFQILKDYNLSRATGPALQNLAIEYGVPPLPAATANGFVTVVDLSFQKIFTTIYAGTNPPNIGSTTIYVSNASNFPATGAVYIGRGTVNVEGPIAYSAVTPVGSYYSITLSAPTTRYHNIGETVILSQGGVRTVPINTVVISPGIGTTPTIQFSVTQTGTILDGETTVTNVPITAQLPGSSGNVAAGAISQFSGNPAGLPNASVTNPLATTTGADLETDSQLRVRVQNALASTGLGTVTAIESALIGVQDPTGSDSIVSVDVLNSATNCTVYIDNGAILEATHTGVAIEAIVNSALGGEKFFQLVTGGVQTSVTKALLQTVAAEPFNLSGGEYLTVVVGDITYNHIFAPTDFANPGSATAYEVCASINGDTVLNFEAVTAGGGTYVVIRPEDEVTNSIQVVTPAESTEVNANNFLQFPSEVAKTLRLYKNGILLIEDGTPATIFTNPQSLWSPTIANGETLSLEIDGTAPITFTLTNADFLAEGSYTTISASNSLQSWVNVLNNVVTGVTASIVGSTLALTSNLGPVDRAQITVVNTIANPTSLISKGFISNTDLTSTGVASQYILDRNTAQIELVSALVAGDALSAGYLTTEANIEGALVPSGSVTLTSDAHVWISIDSAAILIPTIQTGSLLSVTQVSPNVIRYTSNSSTAFENVDLGDYLIVWSLEIPSTDRFEGRVHAVTGSTLDIMVTVAEYTAATPVTDAAYVQGFVVVRTANVPNKFTVPSGTSTLQVIAADLQAQTDELTFGVSQNTNITVVDNTLNTEGKLTIVTADSFGQIIGFVAGVNSAAQTALLAYYQTEATAAELPLFFDSTISADSYVNEYTFTTLTANASTGAVYSNNGQLFTVNSTIVASTTLVATSNGGPPTTTVYPTNGTLTKVSGTGDATISYSDAEPNNLTSFTSSNSLSAFDPNELIAFLNPYTINAVLTTTGTTTANTNQLTGLASTVGLSDGMIIVGTGIPLNTTVLSFSGTTVSMSSNATASGTITVVFNLPADDEQPFNEVVQMSTVSGDAVTILPDYPNVKRLRTNDRFYVANPLDFGYNDSVVAIVNNNALSETYTMPLYRAALVNSNYPPNNYSFDAYDTSTGPTASFATNFSTPVDFFANYKVLLQAKYVVQESAAQTALLFRAVPYGRSGEQINIAYVYPTSANQPIGSTVTLSPTGGVDIAISLISGATLATTIAASTQWNVSVTSNTPSAGTDQLTFTYAANQYVFTVTSANATAGATYTNNGQTFTVVQTISSGTKLITTGTGAPTASGTLTKATGTGDATITFSSYYGAGTAPNLPVSLSSGAYVTILPSTGFNVADTGTFLISTVAGFTPTSTSFSVQVPTGTAVAQLGVLTGVPSGIYFYATSPTTAAAINTYVNANLTQYVTSTIVDDGGSSGSGVIGLSTYQNSGFTVMSYYLKDGINWILSSNVGGSPQFTLKEALTYPSDTGYSFFSSGETVLLIPTTMDQVKDFWNILAVTGFTTVGTIEVADRGNKLQLATNTIGSVGSVQVVGGSGNEYVVPILTSGNLLGNNEMVVSANSIASQAVASDQWFRLQAQSAQNKDTGISNNTSVTVLSNTPIAGESTVTLLNQEAGQLYFGGPRNFVRVEGDTFRIEPQGDLACLSWNGMGTPPGFSSATNFNASGGGTFNVSNTGVYTIASGAANFAALSIGDLITITGAANTGNNGTFFVESVASNGLSFDIDNPNAVTETGTTYNGSTFTSTASVTEGDTMILSAPFQPLNQGSFRVIRVNNNSIWYENANVIEEEETCTANPVSTGYDATTVFNLASSGGTSTLSWTGTGTPPALGLTLPGDIITLGTGFASNNQGSFSITSSGVAQTQIAQFTFPAGSTFSSSGAGDYFEVFSGSPGNKYYIWFSVNGGSNTDPAPAGFTGIEVTINASDSASTVASEVYTAINGHMTGLSASYVALTNVVTIATTATAATDSPVDVSMPAAFSFVVSQTGQEPFLTFINPAGSTQSGVSSVTFSINRPQIQFFQYEATVPGDLLAVSGTVLGAGNAGTYKILQVLSPDTVIVSGTITTQYNTNVGGNYASLNVQEGVPYTGYKQVAYTSFDFGSSNYNNIVFNTSAQYEKIGLSAGVAMTSLGKLNFPTTIVLGIDAYNYDTGLIGAANRVVYGDPRDAVTYPGVNAAGTDIFIREPLLKSVSVALAIRTNIGVSFAQITSQIQSSVYSLISSNPIGTSIDLSSIIETVRAIPGVTSVVLTSPTYTVSSDEIVLTTGEKAFIANQVTGISVSLIGS